MKTILMIIGSDTFRDEEYFFPKELFEKNGYTITTASDKKIAQSKIAKTEIVADKILHDIDLENLNYDAVVFVGGPGAQVFFEDKIAHSLAWKMYEQGKVVSAICIAPVILAKSGLLTGKKSTVWEGGKSMLCTGDCLYDPKPVVVDGRIVTGNGPEAATEFAEAVLHTIEKTY